MLKKYWRQPVFKLIILVMFLSCLGLFAIGASSTSFFARKTHRNPDFAALRQRGVFPGFQSAGQSDSSGNKEEPTLVQEGMLSDKEKKHSKIYEKEYAWRNARKLRDLRGTGEIAVTILEPTVPDNPDAPSTTVNDFLRRASCKADAIVIGTIQTKASQITEDGQFTFSQYAMTVDEILKNNPATPIVQNRNIEITRPGGAIRLNGRVIRVSDLSFPLFRPNAQYLVFLQFIPETGSYKAVRQGDYELVGTQFSPLVSERLPVELRSGVNRASLLELLRSAISFGCN